MTEIFISPGLRTPFTKAGGAYASQSMMSLSAAVASAIYAQASPDLLVWGHVVPSATISNIARELIFKAGMNPRIPAFSTTLACSTSFMGAIEAAGMIGHSDLTLALVGGVETMSDVSLALKTEAADRVQAAFSRDPSAAAATLGAVGLADFDLARGAWANKQSGRSQGQHTRDTARHYAISREAQDRRALLSHQAAVAGQEGGFFDDLVIPFAGLERDTLPRRDTSLEKLAQLPSAFDAGGALTAGNSSPVTDGAASVWIGNRAGMARLGRPACVRLLAWQITAMDYLASEEGILMAPARGCSRGTGCGSRTSSPGTSTRPSPPRCWPMSPQLPTRSTGSRRPRSISTGGSFPGSASTRMAARWRSATPLRRPAPGSSARPPRK
jgi:acetyl-CoA C-acetyltransferase